VGTPKEGNVTLKVPKGYHVIHVTAKGIHVERPYHVIKAKDPRDDDQPGLGATPGTRLAALERQVDDALPYLTGSRKAPECFRRARPQRDFESRRRRTRRCVRAS